MTEGAGVSFFLAFPVLSFYFRCLLQLGRRVGDVGAFKRAGGDSSRAITP